MKERKNKNLVNNQNNHEGGWTFIETIIVIGIVLILTSSTGFMAVKYLDKARIVSARNQIEIYGIALDSYFLDCGSYPGTEAGLKALWEKPLGPDSSQFWNGPYLNKPPSKDPWGNEYLYYAPGPQGTPYGIKSLGSDGMEGGTGNEADISSWE